ncbi:peptidoglycan recognition protein family protein [Agromyces archimandritae]|uniref:N-acetylmuramoyl-L-alanine amidase n=1 Tax=Agromyces archimandritae TaxID=2781962 RepID=A0A975IPE8_9MICO|nr:peptidoglycan recognition family protein [Agromyces archimandritae]QTX03921.1 N-acetylmuramoyl-L-alanine amidase [Agromyces archimandritae]
MNEITRRTALAGLAAGAAVPLLGAAAVPAHGPGHGRGPKGPLVEQPRIYSGDEWGARPPSATPTVVHARPNKIIVHHTAFPNTADHSLAYAFQNSRDIQDLHMDQNGWLDSGQHFTNSQGGYLTEGRAGSLAALQRGRWMIESAHTVGQNTQSIGIENDGSYHLGAPVPEEQWASLVHFCAYTCQQYGIPATEIYGHMDFNETLCPGGLHDRLPELRELVAGRLQRRR